MSWGKDLLSMPDDMRLLYQSVRCAISSTIHQPIDCIISKLLKSGGQAGGDPGWEIENLKTEGGSENFYVWLDPDIYPMKPNEDFYSSDLFKIAVRDTLLEYAEGYPEKAEEVKSVFLRYGL